MGRFALFVPFLLLMAASGCKPWRISSVRSYKLPDELAEVSGMAVKDSLLWMLNDGGNAAVLYAADLQGRLRQALPMSFPNEDWEELATDPQGNFYLFDFGNNRNIRQDLRIYIWKTGRDSAALVRFRYADQPAFPPAQLRFDAEAAFWWADSLWIFSKYRYQGKAGATWLYALPATPGDYTLSPTDSLPLRRRMVTGAAINPDGEAVAFTAYHYGRIGFIPYAFSSLYLLDNFPGNQFLRGRVSRYRMPRWGLPQQVEALTWLDPQNLLLSCENSRLGRQRFYHLQLRKRRVFNQ